MSSETTTKLMTAEEFCDWVHRPENDNKWFELVRGIVIELPRPQRQQGVVACNVARLLGNYLVRRRKGYLASNDAGVILERDPDTVRGPDIALYEDVQSYAEIQPAYGEVPPRLAVEVLSPNDRADQLLCKILDYLRNGVALLWLVDPGMRTVTVFHADLSPRVARNEEMLDVGSVLPGFHCRVADFFLLPGEQPEIRNLARKPRPKKNSG